MAPNWKGPIRMKENPVALLTSGRIAAELGVRLPRVVYVRADERVPFGAFATVMEAVKGAGITYISIVTQPFEK